jgi:lipid-binding SYLF domain-containing protein
MMPLLAKHNEPVKRLDEASAVFSEVMAIPDKGIPEDMLANAHCIVIVPGLKTGAFVVGGKYGKATYPVATRAAAAGRRLARSGSRAGASASRSVARRRI